MNKARAKKLRDISDRLVATLAIALLAGCAQPEGVQRWAEATGAFNSTQTVSISGRDLAAIDGRECA